MIQKVSSLVLLAFLSTTVFAKSSDLEKPYHVKSDQVLYDRNHHRTTYTGHVIATQGTTTVRGSQLVLFSSAKTGQVNLLVVTGDLAHYSTLPNNKKHKLRAQAKTIKYWPQQHKVLLVKKGKVTQHHNVFTGSLIWYDVNKETVLSSSSHQGRTTIVIQPQHIQTQDVA